MSGERRIITVLFCDVTGSTSFAESLDPEEWTEIMNEAFEYMTQPVARYEGTVARLMGDGILALFGAPTAHEDDPQRAVLAGLDIVDSIKEFREDLLDEYGMEFNVRVGINTGPVVVGDVGSEFGGEYTAMGDAVNLAARMEQTASPGTVQISEDTRQFVAPLFDLEGLGDIEVKGKSDPVAAYQVLRPTSEPGRLRGIEGLTAPMIGREAEFDILRDVLEQTRQGRGGIVSLIGEAGLGKSRLLEELQKEWGDESSWIVSRGVSYDTTRPYALFQQRVFQIFGIEDRDTPETMAQKISVQPSGYASEMYEALSQAIQVLMAAQGDIDGGPALQGEALKNEVYQACHQMWQMVAGHTPTVMIVDDLHWSDQASADLLIDLLPLVEEVPLLIFCAYRPERQSPAWKLKQAAEADFPHVYTEVQITPLADDDSDTLVDNLLAISNLPRPTRDLILQKSDGNPFFVEEVVRGLIDSGAVIRDDVNGTWMATQYIQNIEIPDNLQGLILTRMDRLDSEAKQVMQMASVVGRNFQHSILNSVWTAETPVDRHLNTLQRAGLVVETARVPEREYTFKHELTRDAAYSSILRRRRRQFHRAVGSALEEMMHDRLDEQAHRLAEHFGEAMDRERALRYSTVAGDQSLRMFANAEAATHYDRAIAIAKSQEGIEAETLIHLYSSRAAALQELARFDDMIAGSDELAQIGEERGDESLVLASLIPRATVHVTFTSVHDSAQGEKEALQALDMATRLNDPYSRSRAHWLLMLVGSYGSGDLEMAIQNGEAGLAVAREHGCREELAYILNDLARVYKSAGRMEEALDLSLEARQMWEEMGRLPMLIDNYVSRGNIYYETGRQSESFEELREAVRISEEIGNVWGLAGALAGLSVVHLDRGEFDTAIERVEESNRTMNASFTSAQAMLVGTMLGWAYCVSGRFETGIEEAKPYVVPAEQFPQFFRLINAVIGLNHLKLGRSEDSEEFIEAALGDLESDELDPYLGINVGALEFYPVPIILEILLESDHLERAIEFAEFTETLMRDKSIEIYLSDVLLVRGVGLCKQGRIDEAGAVLSEAVEVCRKTKVIRNLWRVLHQLAVVEQAAGNDDAAQALNSEAIEVVNRIADTTEIPERREAFLNQQAVREVLQTTF